MSKVLQKLEDLCVPQPKSKIKAGEGLEEGKYKFFTSSNIQNKFYNKYQFDKPALIFGTGGNASIHYCDEPFSTSTDCIVMFAKNNTVNLKAIYIYLECNIHILEEGFHGAGLKHISKSYLLNIVISQKTFELQEDIINIFDKISLLLEMRKLQLDKFDLFIKSKFIEMFGNPAKNEYVWELRALETISQIGSSKRIFEREYVNDGVPFFRTKEIVELSKGENISTELFISNERFKEIQNEYGCPQKGDLLISAVGTIGVIWLVDDREFYFKDGNLIQVRTNLNSLFLKFVLEWLIADYKQEMSKGTAYAALTISALRKMKIIIPPIELQNNFAHFVEQVEKAKLKIKQSLEKLETLKKALMQKYFG